MRRRGVENEKAARRRPFAGFYEARSALHGIEELVVGLRVLHLVEHELHRAQFIHRVEQLAQDPDLGEQVRLDEQVFATGARAVDVDGRVDALLGDTTGQVHFHVAGALELLVDHLVHLRAGISQRRGDDRQAAAFLDVTRRAEEALGTLQGVGVDTAGQDLAGARNHGVVGTGQTGDRVKQDHHVLLVLDQALGALDHHFGDLHVAHGGLVEGGADDFAANGAGDFRDFLGALIDQQHDQMDIRMVVLDRLGNVLQHHRLTGLRLGDDEATLPSADRRDEVEDAAGDVLGRPVAALELERLAREQRGEVLEQQLVLGRLRRIAVDVVDLEHREIAFAFLRMADATGDVVAGAQVEAADLAGRDVDIVGTGQVGLVSRAQEAEAVLQDLEHAFRPDATAGTGVGLQDIEDDVLLALAGHALAHTERFGELEQLDGVLALELGQVDQAIVAAGVGVLVVVDGIAVVVVALLVVAATAALAVARVATTTTGAALALLVALVAAATAAALAFIVVVDVVTVVVAVVAVRLLVGVVTPCLLLIALLIALAGPLRGGLLAPFAGIARRRAGFRRRGVV